MRRHACAAVAVALVAFVSLVAVAPGGRLAAQTNEEVPPPVLVVGHRGAAAVDVLECDLQLTSDEQLVCLHDTTVDRTTGGTHEGRVDSYALAQLREMDFGSWFGPEFAGAKIVTLEEQITCYGGVDPTMQFYVETKAPAEYGGRMEPLLIAELTRLDVMPTGEPDPRTSRVIVQSFDANSLASVRQLAPSLPVAQLAFATPPLVTHAGVALDVIAPGGDTFEPVPDQIEAAHAAGVEVHTWTIDEAATMATIIDAGIDGFFTNDPATARDVVDAKGRGSGRTAIADPDETNHAPGCPEGMGIGITGAEVESTTTSTDATDDSAESDSGDESGSGSSSSMVPWIIFGAVVIGGALVSGIYLFRRRPPS